MLQLCHFNTQPRYSNIAYMEKVETDRELFEINCMPLLLLDVSGMPLETSTKYTPVTFVTFHAFCIGGLGVTSDIKCTLVTTALLPFIMDLQN